MQETLHHLLAVWMQFVLDWGYLGVFVMMAFESTAVPIPAEVVIPPAAFWAAQGRFNVYGIVLAATAGSWAGSAASYWIALKLGRPLVERYGKYVLMSKSKIEAADHWVDAYGAGGIFVARLLPGIRHVISIPAGLFEMNFRDERYLPFECAGAISQWHLRLSAAVPQFDYSTIADVVLHVKYTSREGGDLLRGDAITSLQTKINTMLVSLKDTGLMRMFSARHEFPTEWYAFLNPASPAVDQVLSLNITRDRFPYFASVAANLKIRSIELVADSSVSPINAIQVAPAPLNAPPLNLTADGYYGTMPRLILDYSAAKKNPGVWTITNPAANTRLTGDQVNDLLILVHYEVS